MEEGLDNLQLDLYCREPSFLLILFILLESDPENVLSIDRFYPFSQYLSSPSGLVSSPSDYLIKSLNSLANNWFPKLHGFQLPNFPETPQRLVVAETSELSDCEYDSHRRSSVRVKYVELANEFAKYKSIIDQLQLQDDEFWHSKLGFQPYAIESFRKVYYLPFAIWKKAELSTNLFDFLMSYKESIGLQFSDLEICDTTLIVRHIDEMLLEKKAKETSRGYESTLTTEIKESESILKELSGKNNHFKIPYSAMLRKDVNIIRLMRYWSSNKRLRIQSWWGNWIDWWDVELTRFSEKIKSGVKNVSYEQGRWRLVVTFHDEKPLEISLLPSENRLMNLLWEVRWTNGPTKKELNLGDKDCHVNALKKIQKKIKNHWLKNQVVLSRKKGLFSLEIWLDQVSKSAT